MNDQPKDTRLLGDRKPQPLAPLASAAASPPFGLCLPLPSGRPLPRSVVLLVLLGRSHLDARGLHVVLRVGGETELVFVSDAEFPGEGDREVVRTTVCGHEHPLDVSFDIPDMKDVSGWDGQPDVAIERVGALVEKGVEDDAGGLPVLASVETCDDVKGRNAVGYVVRGQRDVEGLWGEVGFVLVAKAEKLVVWFSRGSLCHSRKSG